MNEKQSILSDLERVFIVVGISEPIHARYIGQSKGKYIFEPTKHNFESYKNGIKFILVREFDIPDFKIMEKRVIVVKK